ncbi:cytochrome p450 [Trichoderma cornu-damae]|uniref:Cytochrome p450 n=1 Tax=Trichoderma cornu-damae TaxID=654480 RepID=A0A9P8TSJ6_9HYPO|nr:cytochrome p450 [Trichoderma cornu-damae]
MSMEPPIVKPSIPLIGHFVGFYRHGVNYLDCLSHAALKSKSMSMDPLTAYVAPKMLGLSKESGRHFGIDRMGFYRGSPILQERREQFSHALAPGPGVNQPGQVCANIVAEAVNDFGVDWTTKDLFLWLRNVITLGTANGLYGPKSPAALDKSLIQDIWTFDENQLRLSWGVLPNLIAPTGVRAISKISQAFKEFFKKGNNELASEAVKLSFATARKIDVSVEDYSRIEVFNVSVATVNTVPTAVALIQNVLTNTDLLQALRKELEVVLVTKDTPYGRHSELDIGRVEADCPLLHACYQEALRIGSMPTCNRAVLEDVVLTDPDSGREILFKRGWRVSIPTFLLHKRNMFWGGDAESFKPENFLPGGIAIDSKGKVRTQGFVPYGGGAHLCPGRHLAKVEIIASGALVIMALDFEAENGFIAQNYTLNSGAKKPLGLDKVKVRRRKGWENITWSIKI